MFVLASCFCAVTPDLMTFTAQFTVCRRHTHTHTHISRSSVCSGCVPGLLSVGGDSRSLIWASLTPSTHCTSRVRRRGQLEVHRADTAAQEHPDSRSTRRPAGGAQHTHTLGKQQAEPSKPVVPNPRAVGRHRSVGRVVPVRTEWMLILIIFVLFIICFWMMFYFIFFNLF